MTTGRRRKGRGEIAVDKGKTKTRRDEMSREGGKGAEKVGARARRTNAETGGWRKRVPGKGTRERERENARDSARIRERERDGEREER